MLINLKSKYIINIIFSVIKEERKLKLVKYNKKLQNRININLLNYKFYSKKYIIFEENGKGKEYDRYNDKLEFEGEYLNGKRNGKGKEYDYDGKLIFEGEYLNEKKWNWKGYEKNKIILELNDDSL